MPLLPIASQLAVPSVLRFFHPVLKASALRDKPVRVSVAGQAYALFRDQTGRACAVADRCPHRFAPLSEGRVRPDGRLACPYHGWHFDGDGQGQSPSQPSLQHCNVHALRVEERMGYLWLGERDADPTSLDAMFAEHTGFDFAGAFEVRMDAALEHVLDIFSDAEHPAWVHKRLAWSEAQVADIAYADQRKPDSSSVQTSGPQRSSFVSRVLGIQRTDRFNNHWVTRFDPVRGHYNVFWTSHDGQSRRSLGSKVSLFMVPESERVTKLVVFVHSRRDGSRPRLPYGLLKRLLVVAAKLEILDDARFVALLKDVPLTTQGMRLGRMDGVILHNRRLLERLYFKRPALPASAREPLTLAQAPQKVSQKSADAAQASA